MSILHHPSDETLAGFASGALDVGRAVVVATHVALCPRCAGAMRAFEHVGGALLEAAAPAPMSAHARERAMLQLSRVTPSVDFAPMPSAFMAMPEPAEPTDVLPAPLR